MSDATDNRFYREKQEHAPSNPLLFQLRRVAKANGYYDHIAPFDAEIERLQRREYVMAQHEETGRYWSGPREDIPHRFAEVPERAEGGPCSSGEPPGEPLCEWCGLRKDQHDDPSSFRPTTPPAEQPSVEACPGHEYKCVHCYTAPPPVDDRAAFERWCAGQLRFAGEYEKPFREFAWGAWQAARALQPPGEAPTVDDFIELLKCAGWRSTYDAQLEGAAKLHGELFGATSTKAGE